MGIKSCLTSNFSARKIESKKNNHKQVTNVKKPMKALAKQKLLRLKILKLWNQPAIKKPTSLS